MHIPAITTLTTALLTTLSHAAHLTFTIAPSTLLSNPSSLTASTRATLFKHSTTLSVPLTRRNTFEYRNLTSGSYLFTVQARDHTFGPLRVDVVDGRSGSTPVDVAAGSGVNVGVGAGAEQSIEVHQTFWGNEWGNKGEYRGGAKAAGDGEVKANVEIRAERVKQFYEQRQGFDPISFLKSPMILMGLVSLLLIVGIPYMTEGMDEETKAEFEEMQRKSPLSKGTTAARSGIADFDLASWMAGKLSVTSGAGDGESDKNR